MRKYLRGKFPINTLLKCKRGFIDTDGLDSWSFSCSVNSFPLEEKDIHAKRPKEVIGYSWSGGFELYVAHTKIRLHDPFNDFGLLKLETKLDTVRTSFNEYIKLMEERGEKEAKAAYFDRKWLNPSDWQSDYTGYVSGSVCEQGGGRVSIADCQRSICLWVDGAFRNTESDLYAQFKENRQLSIDRLRKIGTATEKATDQIVLLRASFEKVLKESEEISK